MTDQQLEQFFQQYLGKRSFFPNSVTGPELESKIARVSVSAGIFKLGLECTSPDSGRLFSHIYSSERNKLGISIITEGLLVTSPDTHSLVITDEDFELAC